MNFDLKDFKKGKRVLTRKHQSIATLLRRHKVDFSPKMERSPYESLVRSIAHQQLHGKAAETILGRMLALFPKHSFPPSQSLDKIDGKKLRACGFSENKVKSIKDIAAKTEQGLIPSKKDIEKMPNQEIIDRLTEIYGVGRWTVEMLLIFQLGRLDVWPVDDFGVRKGFQVWKKRKQMPTAKELKKFSAQYAPYQTIMALHLWREADLTKTKVKTQPIKKKKEIR